MSAGAKTAKGGVAAAPGWLLWAGPLLLIVAAIGAFAIAGGPGLGERTGPPVEDLQVERTTLRPGEIELAVRNAGPDALQVAQVTVNDAFVDFSGDGELGRLEGETLKLDYPWQEGSPYEVSMLLSSGTTITHEIEAAAESPEADAGFFGLMALLGIYVGLIPVGLGMLFTPFMRSIRERWLQVLMAATIGLLGFLAVDAYLEGVELGDTAPSAFGGLQLLFAGGAVAFLTLSGLDAWLREKRAKAKQKGADGWRLSLMVAIGIGLHNLGEGLAIGSAYAIGSLALGAFLVVGFAIHNTTEGLAIVAPLARSGEHPGLGRLALLGAIAGGPAILGAIIGATAYDPELLPVPARARYRRDRPGHRPADAVDPRRRRAGAQPGERHRHPRRRRRPLSDQPPGGDMSPGPAAHNAHPGRENAEGTENYAKAIYQLQARGEKGTVGTGAVAERLGVTSATASAMLRRMADEGLVEHAPYQGVSLTPSGEQVALEVIRHHRLLETYLSQALGMPWDRVHEEAEVLEHYISEDLEALIAAELGDPSHDPHGDPIPGPDLTVPESDKSVALDQVEIGEEVAFTRVSDRDPAMLRYLADRGILPGVELTVTGRQPFGGPLLVDVDGREHALGDELARRMRVSPKS